MPAAIAWAVVFVTLGILAPRLGGELTPGGFEVTGSDSAAVAQVTSARFSREYPSGLTAVIETAPGPGARVAITRAARRVRTVAATYPDLVRAVEPVRFGIDGRTGAVLIGLDASLDRVLKSVDPFLDALKHTSRPDATVLITGGAAVFRDFDAVNEHDLRRAEIIQAPVIILILLVLMGTALGAAMPVVGAAVAMVTTFGALWFVARGIDLTIYVKNIVPLVGIGVSVDYALFIVTRFREELANGSDVDDAVVTTAATAGRAVFFSGLTVIVALGAMATVRVPMFTAFAVGATAVVAAAVAVALTLVPALLSLLGRRLQPSRAASGPLGTRSALRMEEWARRVMRRPALSLVLATALLVVLALPVASMRLGSSGSSAIPSSMPSIRAGELIARNAGPGAVAPIRVIVDGHGTAPDPALVAATRRAIARDAGVVATTRARNSDDGTMSVFEVVSAYHEDDQRSHDLVTRLRTRLLPSSLGAAPVTTLVGGAPAQNADFVAAVADRLPLVIGLVMGLSFLVLIVVFRSVVLPLKAVVVTLLSVLASYGVLVAVFQWGWLAGVFGFEPLGHVTAWVPPFLFCLLFGLSMDYEVFLLTRIRERLERSDDQLAAIAWGVGRSGRIITAAAAIMIVVFLSFVTNRLVPVKEASLGLAVAVLIDATVVRIVLVPAFMTIVSRWNWWMPAWLERVLPAPSRPPA